jgi:hypothetical protein
MRMLAIALFSWWYTTAWVALGRRIERRLDQSLDFFSVGLLLRTLFDPFRQIAAVKGHGSLDVQMRAWADRTFSRFFGAFVRTLFIIIGVVVSAIIMIIGGVQMILWPCVPLLPVIAIVGYVMGWVV